MSTPPQSQESSAPRWGAREELRLTRERAAGGGARVGVSGAADT